MELRYAAPSYNISVGASLLNSAVQLVMNEGRVTNEGERERLG